jgi:DNA mismatch repair protein MutS2
VRLGGARIAVTASRVTSARAPAARAGGHQIVRAPDRGRASAECDLRGMRVDEALERAEAHLHRALGTDVHRVLLIHGHGTGALRSALRAWLRGVPGVAEFAPAAANEGGNGVTVVTLAQ